MKIKFIFIVTLFFLTYCNLYAEGKMLKFGVFPVYGAKSMIKIFSPIAQKLEKELGIPVRIFSANSKSSFEKRVIAGEYDIIWTCNSCYFKAKDKSMMSVIARGTPAFTGVVLVRKDSGIKTVSDLKGKKIVAIGEHSVAGYLFLRNLLLDNGIAADEVFFDFLGQIESLPFKVYNKNYDACVFSESTYLNSYIFNKVRKDLDILVSSVPIPQFPFGVKMTMNPKLSKQIGAVLSTITQDSKEGLKILNTLKLTGIEEAQDSDYDEFREVYQKIRFYSNK